MTPHPIDSTHPVVTLFPHASMNTFAALVRELSSAAAPTDRRVAAAAALTGYPSDSTTWDCLTRARADRDPAVAAAARSALETIFTARPDLVVSVSAEEGGVGSPRYFATLGRLVAGLPTPVALDALFHAMGHAEPEEWRQLLDGAASPTRFPTALLLDLLPTEGDGNRRWVIAQLLADRKVDEGTLALIEGYPCGDVIDDVIAQGLDAVRHLCEIVAGKLSVDGVVAASLAERRRRADAMVHAIALDPASKAAAVAIRTLGRWDNLKSVDTLVKVAGNPAYLRRVRDLALDALCRLEAPEAIELMCDALRDRTVNMYTRRNCAWALGHIGNTGPLELLRAIAKGRSDKEVRDAAKQAIAQIRELASGAAS